MSFITLPSKLVAAKCEERLTKPCSRWKKLVLNDLLAFAKQAHGNVLINRNEFTKLFGVPYA